MTMTMSRPTLESTVHGLVRLHWSDQSSHLSTTKGEVAVKYWQRAIREGIAAILFQHRGDSLPRFKTIPLIYESDVNAVLRKYEKDFVHGRPEEKHIALDAAYQELIELAVPQDLIETDESERRRLVLEGKEPALPDDAKWINDLVEEQRREADRLIAILRGSPVRPSKLGDADPHALWRCTMDECAHLPEHRRSHHDYYMRNKAEVRHSEAARSKVDD